MKVSSMSISCFVALLLLGSLGNTFRSGSSLDHGLHEARRFLISRTLVGQQVEIAKEFEGSDLQDYEAVDPKPRLQSPVEPGPIEHLKPLPPLAHPYVPSPPKVPPSSAPVGKVPSYASQTMPIMPPASPANHVKSSSNANHGSIAHIP